MSEREDAIEKRKSDATSDKTLEDVKESEKERSSDNSGDPGPSPDGRLDEPDELKDAGPM